jgi:hypothetical protein
MIYLAPEYFIVENNITSIFVYSNFKMLLLLLMLHLFISMVLENYKIIQNKLLRKQKLLQKLMLFVRNRFRMVSGGKLKFASSMFGPFFMNLAIERCTYHVFRTGSKRVENILGCLGDTIVIVGINVNPIQGLRHKCQS